jgi:hypothetical protein
MSFNNNTKTVINTIFTGTTEAANKTVKFVKGKLYDIEYPYDGETYESFRIKLIKDQSHDTIKRLRTDRIKFINEAIKKEDVDVLEILHKIMNLHKITQLN